MQIDLALHLCLSGWSQWEPSWGGMRALGTGTRGREEEKEEAEEEEEKEEEEEEWGKEKEG